MKILYLSPQFVYPADDGGKISIYNTVKQYHRLGCEVDFITFSDHAIEDDNLKHLSQFSNLHVIKYSTKNTKLRILRSVFDNYPLYLRKHINRNLINQIISYVSSKKYDFIQAEHSSMAPLALYLKETLKIPAFLRLQNIEHKIWQRYSEVLSVVNPKRYYVGRQARLLGNNEAEMFSKFDMCFTITDEDLKIAQHMSPNGKFLTIHPGVDFNKFSPQKNINRTTNELLHIAFFRWIHNIDAIEWFVHQVMPDLIKLFPTVKLNVIGKGTPANLLNKTINNSYFHGYVDDISPLMNKSLMFVAPLFVGSGIRIKILEALAMELPVIATSIAAEGIPKMKNNGIIIADDKESFVRAISLLINNPEQATQIGNNGRIFVEEYFDWEKNISKMLENIKNSL